MLLTITLTFGEIRKQMIMVSQNFTKLFQKSRGGGLLEHFMKKKLYIQTRFDGHGFRAKRTKIRFNNYASRKVENTSKKYSKLSAPPTSFCTTHEGITTLIFFTRC